VGFQTQKTFSKATMEIQCRLQCVRNYLLLFSYFSLFIYIYIYISTACAVDMYSRCIFSILIYFLLSVKMARYKYPTSHPHSTTSHELWNSTSPPTLYTHCSEYFRYTLHIPVQYNETRIFSKVSVPVPFLTIHTNYLTKML
jgi:hypothetical protein